MSHACRRLIYATSAPQFIRECSKGAGLSVHPKKVSLYPEKSKVTIYDIAREAGVSASTVSRALSSPDRVSSRTRRLIEVTAAELDFRINHLAQVLKTGSTKTLGLVIADVNNPAFFGLLRGAGKFAAQRDYSVVLAQAADSAAQELASAGRLLSAVDGLILASPRMADADIRDLAESTPLVVLNREMENVNTVVPDPEKGASEAIRYLAEHGHKKVLFVAGPEQSWMSARRWETISDACQWCQLKAERIESPSPTLDGGRQVAHHVRAAGATAVITYNDLMAIGLMRQLQSSGVSIPKALSIIGFDDIFGADLTTPSLTSIRSPQNECGSLAAGVLLDALAGPAPIPAALRVGTELIIRGSAGRCDSA
ncbi:LacI family DNA-binding transcriptional regulator [Arthrobacter sp. YN]|uniref:LacI family DNA-binding transcriptional regulator n=1 Tax=Arthrobacter sp. YN TaxID=2020486 RepID=UPI000B612F7D|nr:LacI family DNA-binding transcriptional regulator [Arthrobacter sp. YN]ASN20041.1 LacI family transcriptional regulator [Arthrobacter sp. YN]